jgi:hypothetical protein
VHAGFEFFRLRHLPVSIDLKWPQGQQKRTISCVFAISAYLICSQRSSSDSGQRRERERAEVLRRVQEHCLGLFRSYPQTRQPLPISANALTVLKALLRFMDGKTGRCDPCLDTVAWRSKLSRRTVVRQLEALRRERVIDWVAQ